MSIRVASRLGDERREKQERLSAKPGVPEASPIPVAPSPR